MRPVRWRRVRSSVEGLPFGPVVATQAGREKLAGAKEPSQRIKIKQELTMGVVFLVTLRAAEIVESAALFGD